MGSASETAGDQQVSEFAIGQEEVRLGKLSAGWPARRSQVSELERPRGGHARAPCPPNGGRWAGEMSLGIGLEEVGLGQSSMGRPSETAGYGHVRELRIGLEEIRLGQTQRRAGPVTRRAMSRLLLRPDRGSAAEKVELGKMQRDGGLAEPRPVTRRARSMPLFRGVGVGHGIEGFSTVDLGKSWIGLGEVGLGAHPVRCRSGSAADDQGAKSRVGLEKRRAGEVRRRPNRPVGDRGAGEGSLERGGMEGQRPGLARRGFTVVEDIPCRRHRGASRRRAGPGHGRKTAKQLDLGQVGPEETRPPWIPLAAGDRHEVNHEKKAGRGEKKAQTGAAQRPWRKRRGHTRRGPRVNTARPSP